MLVEEFTVNNKVGLHARPAANFVQTASKFKSKITVIKDGKEVDAKSIIGILSLGVEKGANIKVKLRVKMRKMQLPQLGLSLSIILVTSKSFLNV